MKLEASPIAKTNAGMVNIQNQLVNLTLQLHDMKKGKEVREEVWCTKLLHRKNLPSVGKKNRLAEEHFSLCEIRSMRPLHG